tara:strand:+ start:290 stop:469 length:180 start_codon:yes stop_codon:yes gene_type:complete
MCSEGGKKFSIPFFRVYFGPEKDTKSQNLSAIKVNMAEWGEKTAGLDQRVQLGAEESAR